MFEVFITVLLTNILLLDEKFMAQLGQILIRLFKHPDNIKA
jgi:hypothetical protein